MENNIYYYAVEHKGDYSQYSRSFSTIKEAIKWKRKYGFNLQKLFKRTLILCKFKPKSTIPTGYKYITKIKESGTYSVRIRNHKISKNFKCIKKAIEFRDNKIKELIKQNNNNGKSNRKSTYTSKKK